MFSKTTHYALILMVTLAQHYQDDGVDSKKIAGLYNIPRAVFKEVVKRLCDASLITRKNSNLSLNNPPEKITIWQVVECMTREELAVEQREELPIHDARRSNTVIVIDKELEFQQHIVSNRLKRCMLSTWSKKASNTIYI